ncbi:MAG TPA: hypothetical protein VNM67_21190 [Thermoanaerobaculia bacterium]|jgi:hypothetical protein|nr:hypothetical protein [Thermoanaerobaculia bacterium]
MAGVPDYMKKVVGWDRTTTQITERDAALEHLNAHRAQLEGISQQYKDKSTEYLDASAAKLRLSGEMRNLFRLGETLVHFLRTGVRQHYGVDSQELIAFGLTPTSRRTGAVKPPAEQVADPVPSPDSAK